MTLSEKINVAVERIRMFARFLAAGNVKVACELFLLAISKNIRKVIFKCATDRL